MGPFNPADPLSQHGRARPRPMPDRLASADSVSAVALKILDAPTIARIRAAVLAGPADDAVVPSQLEAELVQIIGRAAIEWEGEYTHNADVEDAIEDIRHDLERVQRLYDDIRGDRAMARLSPMTAAALHRGASAPSHATPATLLAPGLDCDVYDKDGFWRNWADWARVTWGPEVERAVRRGVRSEVIEKATGGGREREDLEALLSAAIDKLGSWRGRQPSKEQVAEVTTAYFKRFWYRHLGAGMQGGQRAVAISAAAGVLEANGLSEAQRESRAAAVRAAMVAGGTAYGHADLAADAVAAVGPSGSARFRRGGGRNGRGAPHQGTAWRPPTAFAGKCHQCHGIGHRRQDCPNGPGSVRNPQA